MSTAKGIRETGARKLRPGWCKGPVGTEGGKPRPDYGLPNLTPRTLNVVNVLGRVFKPYPDAGSHVLRQQPGGEMQGAPGQAILGQTFVEEVKCV